MRSMPDPFLKFMDGTFSKISPWTIWHNLMLFHMIAMACSTKVPMYLFGCIVRNKFLRNADILDKGHQGMRNFLLSSHWINTVVTKTIGINLGSIVATNRLNLSKHSIGIIPSL